MTTATVAASPVPQYKPSTTTIVTGIVALFVVAAALVVGLSLTGAGDKSTPLLTGLISVLAPTIVALVGLLRADQAKAVALRTQLTSQDNYDSLTNGLLQSKVAEGIDRANRHQTVVAEQSEILTLLRRINENFPPKNVDAPAVVIPNEKGVV